MKDNDRDWVKNCMYQNETIRLDGIAVHCYSFNAVRIEILSNLLELELLKKLHLVL